MIPSRTNTIIECIIANFISPSHLDPSPPDSTFLTKKKVIQSKLAML